MLWQEHLTNLQILKSPKLASSNSGEGWMTIATISVKISSHPTVKVYQHQKKKKKKDVQIWDKKR